MVMKRTIQTVVIVSLLVCSSLTLAQYEEEPYIEGFVGGNLSLPMGYISNDLIPDSLNATPGFGLDAGIGYYLKPRYILGLYFDVRNMATDGMGLHHRAFEFGVYGKFLFSNLTEATLSPYVRLSAGVNFSKLAAKVAGEGGVPVYRELSHDPAPGAELSVGLHKKTNERGAIFIEAAFHIDMMNGTAAEYRGVDYEWGDNNQFVIIRAGILFNIGPKE